MATLRTIECFETSKPRSFETMNPLKASRGVPALIFTESKEPQRGWATITTRDKQDVPHHLHQGHRHHGNSKIGHLESLRAEDGRSAKRVSEERKNGREVRPQRGHPVSEVNLDRPPVGGVVPCAR